MDPMEDILQDVPVVLGKGLLHVIVFSSRVSSVLALVLSVSDLSEIGMAMSVVSHAR